MTEVGWAGWPLGSHPTLGFRICPGFSRVSSRKNSQLKAQGLSVAGAYLVPIPIPIHGELQQVRPVFLLPLCLVSPLSFCRMALLWAWLLATELLEGLRDAQGCLPPPGAKNLARDHPATQSSTYPQWGIIYSKAESAVDGDRDGDWSHGSCSHTLEEMEPWWSVDLGARHTVTAVVVKNRQDCCSERIKGAQIHVGDYEDHYGKCSSLCGTVTNTSAGSLSILCCDGLKGRYVSLVIPGRTEYLTLCELEVYGSRLRDEC
ncbi:hypothetical protein JD844_015390 [Phrynosoma platyrhinos]|uniref:F5/8 type C domain-containing protein n=1 Tax=Phrynosoma platyrhinos TaxID=52577 RepID=A0ABQ7SJ43_PHRPL|nr:hypothetical protein JD844_015390 [Phrynosoma platyrhinos]